MTEVISGIYQLRIPIPNNALGYTNTYLLQGDDGYFLIDTGVNTDEAFNSLKKGLSETGIGIKDITQIIATHAHRDHYGLAGKLKQLSGAKVSLHYLEKDLLAPGSQNMDDLLRQTEHWFHSNGVPANELPTSRTVLMAMQRSAAPALPDTILRGGETISTGTFDLQVLWTPGHSPGHICLYEPTRKILFSGDHILPVITPNISLQPLSELNPLSDFLNSLDLVKQLDVDIVLPAHEHIFNDLQKRVEEIIQHHEQRNSEILEAMQAGPKTAYQISTEITWMPEQGGVRFKDLAPWDKRMAISEALAHLEAMRIRGMVEKSSTDTIIYYQPT